MDTDIKWDMVTENRTNAMDGTMFTAPVAGTYHFTLTVMNANSQGKYQRLLTGNLVYTTCNVKYVDHCGLDVKHCYQ